MHSLANEERSNARKRARWTTVMELTIAVACVAAANAAVVAGPGEHRLRLFGLLMSGPVAIWGVWLLTAHDGSLPWAPICASYAIVLPLVAYAVHRTRVALALGAFCWFSLTFFFCIAIWI